METVWRRFGDVLERFRRGSQGGSGEVSGSGKVLGRFWVGSRADLWAPSEEAGKVEIYTGNCFISAGSLTASLDPKHRKLPKEN